jgi:hypothetical protein
MEVKVSEAQGQESRREAAPERSAEQRREPMNKNRIRGRQGRTSGREIAKSISIKGTGCKSGGCAPKAVELTPGDLLPVSNSRLRGEKSFLTRWQESAKGVVCARQRCVQVG